MPVTYEPPRSDLPVGILTGTVFGNLQVAVDDSDDFDIKTDSIPAIGFIRFTPSTPYINHEDTLILLETRHAILEPNGDFEIHLVSTQETSPVTNWRYRVDFFVEQLDIPSFDIQVPQYATLPLTSIIPIITTPQQITVKGDKGDKGDLGIAGLGVYVDNDGDLAMSDSDAVMWGSGNPNGQHLYQDKGHVYIDRNGTNGDYIFIKTTGTTSQTGWAAVTYSGGPSEINWQSAIDIMESP